MATYDDAKIVVQLARWSTEMGLDEAMKEVFSDGFNAKDGSSDSDAARKVLHFGETVGSLVKHNVLDFDLISDLFWFAGLWDRVAAYAKHARDTAGEPRIYEHFEALVAKVG